MELTFPIKRRKSRVVKVGDVLIGGGFPVAVQSMTTADTRDVAATVTQIQQLFDADCDIVRISVLNHQAGDCLKSIRDQVTGPLVADIHFQYKLALKAIEAGFDKIRINPGNIGAEWKVREVTQAAKDRGLPIRIGVNSGSLPDDLLKQYGHDDPSVVCRGGASRGGDPRRLWFQRHCYFRQVDQYRHGVLGIPYGGRKVRLPPAHRNHGIGHPRNRHDQELGGNRRDPDDGIGDTIRVSLTADPVHEPRVAREILTSCALKNDGVEVISCPTCGRCQIDLIPLAESISEKTRHIRSPLKVAVMGCAVNGPGGEARAADVGIAGGDGKGMLIKKGEIVKTNGRSRSGEFAARRDRGDDRREGQAVASLLLLSPNSIPVSSAPPLRISPVRP